MPASSENPSDGIVVFEKQPFWGPELKRQFSKEWIHIHEVRTLQDIVVATEPLTRAALLLSFDAAPVDCLVWLARISAKPPFWPLVVVASWEFADLEWVIREAGAAAFIRDEAPGNHVARLFRRLLRGTTSLPRVAALS